LDLTLLSRLPKPRIEKRSGLIGTRKKSEAVKAIVVKTESVGKTFKVITTSGPNGALKVLKAGARAHQKAHAS
jgi:hypothetical protein